MREVPVITSYSTAFRLKVITEIEKGKLSIGGARKLYGIGGSSTIQKWLKSYGKGELISKVVRIQMKDELEKIKQLEKEKQELESALAREHLKTVCLESLIEVANEHYKTDLKKTFGSKASSKQKKGKRK